MADDVERLRERLGVFEADARAQPWDHERPWRAATHVGWDSDTPTIDLHDLKAGLARKVVRAALDAPPDAGALVFVTGRGRHTVGAGPVLKQVTEGLLRDACAHHPRYRYRPDGPGRWVWISDPDRAPKRWSGGTDRWLTLWFALIAAAGLLALARACR